MDYPFFHANSRGGLRERDSQERNNQATYYSNNPSSCGNLSTQNTASEYENVIKEFLSMYLPSDMSMREMVEFVKIATADHQFFCIDNITGECYISKLSKSQIEC